jgi:hypothetical protein
MSRALIAGAALVAACAAPPGPVPAASPPVAPAHPVVRNAGFEDPLAAGRACPPRWDCSAHVDVGSFRFALAPEGASGNASLCVERVGNEPWALVTQGFHTTALRNKRVRLSMAVRAQGLDGGAGPFLQSQGGRAHAQKLVKSTDGWQRVAVDLDIPAESSLVAVGATLEGGGRACFDDVRLEVL